jgi:hypothetical protein
MVCLIVESAESNATEGNLGIHRLRSQKRKEHLQGQASLKTKLQSPRIFAVKTLLLAKKKFHNNETRNFNKQLKKKNFKHQLFL